jgi:hypothetical protein
MPKIKAKISFEKPVKCKLTNDFDIKKSTKENTENPLAVVFSFSTKDASFIAEVEKDGLSNLKIKKLAKDVEISGDAIGVINPKPAFIENLKKEIADQNNKLAIRDMTIWLSGSVDDNGKEWRETYFTFLVNSGKIQKA